MQLSLHTAKRFQVALSFAGEHRAYVEATAKELQGLLSPTTVFYDNFYLHELARPNLDSYLLRIYRDDSELIVVFLCPDYVEREWCGLEWRAVRDLIKSRRATDVMLFVFGEDEPTVEGLLSIDGYIRIANRQPLEVADLIAKRYSLRAGALWDKAVVEIVVEEEFDELSSEKIDGYARLIQRLLQDNTIRIVAKRRGSAVLTLLLSESQLKLLLGAAAEGRLVGGVEVRRLGNNLRADRLWGGSEESQQVVVGRRTAAGRIKSVGGGVSVVNLEADFFITAASSEVAQLAQRGAVRNFRRGAQIFEEGDLNDSVFVVLTGRLRAFSKDGSGREITFETYGPGDYFGELSLDGGPRAASVEAIEPATCAMISRVTLVEFIAEHPAFALELLARVIRRARGAQLNLKQHALTDVYSRLSALLLERAKPTVDGQSQVDRMTHKEMANQVGSSRQMVSRILKDLEANGYIRSSSKRILLLKQLPAKW